MRVIKPGLFAQRLPCLDRYMTVGLWGQLKNHFTGINISLNFRHTAGDALCGNQATELAQLLDLRLCIPRNTLAAVAHLVHEWTKGSKALVYIGIVTFNDRNVGRCFSGYQINLTALPVLHAERLCQFGWAVMHQWCQHHFLFDTQVTDTHFAEFSREPFVDVPVAPALPGRIYGCRQRMNKGMHVTGIEIILFVPGRGG